MDRKLNESCGVVGAYNVPNAAEAVYLGLHALQHRGQESAGIVVSDGRNVRSRKGMGLLAAVFSAVDLQHLTGHIGAGHVRYSTTGSSKPQNTQPLVMDYAGGLIAVAHNGNLVNAQELRRSCEGRGSIFQTSTDSEIIVHLLAQPDHMARKDNLAHCLGEHLRGAYSFVFLAHRQILAARDPQGFRPLSLGTLGGGYVVASETCAFDQMGAEFLREIEPGELLTIDENGLQSERIVPKSEVRPAHCIFEHIYFARPDSVLFGDSVHLVRKRLGIHLAREHPADADLVAPIPDSGNSAAIGYALESGLPLDRGLIRNHYIGRTFLNPVPAERRRAAQLKHNVVKDVVRGKRIVLVDDSLIRGTTLRALVQFLQHAGAREVHLRISCPPNRFPCLFGVDFPTREELIAATHTREEIESLLRVRSLCYLSVEGMLSSVTPPADHFCTACFDNRYPIEPVDTMADKYRMERRGAQLEEETKP
ncbi:MAG: amidophosphoribosyltransferase [Planctomycetota bacterium]